MGARSANGGERSGWILGQAAPCSRPPCARPPGCCSSVLRKHWPVGLWLGLQLFGAFSKPKTVKQSKRKYETVVLKPNYNIPAGEWVGGVRAAPPRPIVVACASGTCRH